MKTMEANKESRTSVASAQELTKNAQMIPDRCCNRNCTKNFQMKKHLSL